MGSLIKKRKSTWHKSCKEGQNREQDLLLVAEELRTQGSKDEENRTVLVKRPSDVLEGQKNGRKALEEEKTKSFFFGEGTEEVLLEKRRIQEGEVWEVFEDYMRSWDSTQRGVDSIAEKIWEPHQSNNTKTKNLEQDWKGLAARAEDFGWSKKKKTKTIRELVLKRKQDGVTVNFRQYKGSRTSSETFILSLGIMSTSTYSSSAQVMDARFRLYQ